MLSVPRFRWRTVPCSAAPATAHDDPLGSLVESGKRETNGRHGAAFRALRAECGLSLGDVARGWGVSVVEVSELERGLRRFPSPADLWAALQQLWCWGTECNRGALYEARE